MFEGHRKQLRQSVGSEPLPESDREDDRASRSGQPSPDGSLEARKREDSVGLLSAPSSQPSPRPSLLGSRNGSATSLTRIGSAFRSRSRSRNESSCSGSGSGGSSRHNSHVTVSSAPLALGRARAHSLIQGMDGASRSSIELVLGRISQPGSPSATGACAWATHLMWMGVRVRWVTQRAIRSACLSLVVLAACFRAKQGCMYVRL